MPFHMDDIITKINYILFDYDYKTTEDKPFCYSSETLNRFYINYNYFVSNKKLVLLVVENILSKTLEKKIMIQDGSLLSSNFADLLTNNSNIGELYLLDNTYLDKEIINKLLNSNLEKISCYIDFSKYPELKEEYINGLNIRNYPSNCRTNVTDFKNGDVNLIIDDKFSVDDLLLLKKLFKKYPQQEVNITFMQKDNLKSILNIINSAKIIIKSNDIFKKKDYLFITENYNNIYFNCSFNNLVKPKILYEKEMFFDMVINEVNNYELSPLEKYMYLYNITKKFKEYKEVPLGTSKALSRYSEFVLFNDYMVCVGYASLLEELVQRLNNSNILCSTYSCKILDDDGYFTKDQYVGHSRCIVKIKDDKYGIDGVYISDPTWDCISYYEKKKKKNGKTKINYRKPTSDKDYYNYFLLTKDEMLDDNVIYKKPDLTTVMFGGTLNFEDDLYLKFIKQDVNEALLKLNIDCNSQKFLNDRDKVIITKPISGEIIMDSAKSIYQKIYSINEVLLNNLLKNIREDNINRQYKQFNDYKDKFGMKQSKVKKKGSIFK